MVKSPLWLRVLAPCLGLTLGGGLVWTRHKEAEAARIKATAAEAEAAKTRILPGSKAPWGLVDQELMDQGGTILPGSKSSEVIRYKPSQVKEEPTPQVLPGSKSGIMITPEDSPITVLPSSKSISPILENPRREPQAPPAQQAAEPKPENGKP